MMARLSHHTHQHPRCFLHRRTPATGLGKSRVPTGGGVGGTYFEQATDDREYYDCEDGHHNTISEIHNQFSCRAWKRTSSPAPGVEGGNDGLHGDELILGEGVDKEDGRGASEGVLVWSVSRECRLSGGKDREVGYRMIAPLKWGPSDAVSYRRRGLSGLGVRCQDAKTPRQIPNAQTAQF